MSSKALKNYGIPVACLSLLAYATYRLTRAEPLIDLNMCVGHAK